MKKSSVLLNLMHINKPKELISPTQKEVHKGRNQEYVLMLWKILHDIA